MSENSTTGQESSPGISNPYLNEKGDYKITFHGSYTQYLGIALYNLLLTVLTLGIYYPWAKCAIRKFIWQETEIAGSRLEWHGTGKEMFRGFIKAYLFMGVFLFIINFGPMFIPPRLLVFLVLGSYLCILALVPLIIHGMARYRMSRTSLRGIQFGYRGKLGEFYKKTALDFLYTMLTFGIYGAWLQINIRKYVMKHMRFGSVSAGFYGSGGGFFGLSIVQGLLIAITFYIYTPWAIVAFFKYYVTNSALVQNEHSFAFKSNATGGKYFWTLIKAAFITVVTFGICAPIGQLMIHKYFAESISLSGGFDFDSVEQTEKAYTDATGDDMADILDLDF